ncbi:MAG TPA: thioredoxin family protein, partial [Quisquiliibacterium sp.]|nr:thioredoxin family protein [Quisquiliibacterium sp.]
MPSLPDGLVVVAKRECPTCTLVEPLLAELAAGGTPVTVYVQDDPAFGRGATRVVDDTRLEHSYALDVEIVPTLIRVEDGREVERTY